MRSLSDEALRRTGHLVVSKKKLNWTTLPKDGSLQW